MFASACCGHRLLWRHVVFGSFRGFAFIRWGTRVGGSAHCPLPTPPRTNQTPVSLRAWASLWSLGATEVLHNPLQVAWPADGSGTLAGTCISIARPRLTRAADSVHRRPVSEKLADGRLFSRAGRGRTLGLLVCLAAPCELPENCRELDRHQCDRCFRSGGVLLWQKMNVFLSYNSKLFHLFSFSILQ